MTRNLLSTILLWIACTILISFCFVVVASAQEDSTKNARPAHIGFIYPLSTNGTQAATISNHFSLHVLAGVSQNELAFCLSGISTVVKEDAHGALISGIFNHVGNRATGLQMAGVLNITGKEATGLQLAGLANIANEVEGAQIAGLANTSTRTQGVQVAGLANSSKDADVQVAGFSNTTQHSKALQLAGFINVAHDANTQISGFMNVAKKVRSVQIAGLINIAEECDYPIGLVNIIKNGEQQLGLTIDESGTAMLGFRSGGKVLYGILAAGYNFRDDHARYALEGGLGAHFSFNKYFRTNIEVTSSVLTDLQHNVYMKSTTRLLAALKLANRVELFAGPDFNYLGYERGQQDIRRDHYLWKERNGNHINGLYIGLTGGVHINL